MNLSYFGNVTPQSIGQWIAAQRNLRDETQAEMADALGCERSHLSNIETNKERPSKHMAHVIGAHLNVPPEHVPEFIRLVRRLPSSCPIALPATTNGRHEGATISEPDYPAKPQAFIICVPLMTVPDPAELLQALSATLQQFNNDHLKGDSSIAA